MATRLKDNVFTPSGTWFAKGTLRSAVDPSEASTIGDHLWEDTDGATDGVVGVPDSTPVDTTGDNPLDPAIPPAENPVAAPPAVPVVPAPAGPATSSAAADVVPPRGGPGSGKDVWAAYARQHGVTIEAGANRDDIIDALDEAGVATGAQD